MHSEARMTDSISCTQILQSRSCYSRSMTCSHQRSNSTRYYLHARVLSGGSAFLRLSSTVLNLIWHKSHPDETARVSCILLTVCSHHHHFNVRALAFALDSTVLLFQSVLCSALYFELQCCCVVSGMQCSIFLAVRACVSSALYFATVTYCIVECLFLVCCITTCPAVSN